MKNQEITKVTGMEKAQKIDGTSIFMTIHHNCYSLTLISISNHSNKCANQIILIIAQKAN